MNRRILFAAGVVVVLSLRSVAQGPEAWGGAVWVWDEPDAHKVAQSNEPRYLRRTFELSAKPAMAELWITADNHYIAYVNGQQVGADGNWNTVEKIDVARHLVVGKNVLAIKATNQGGVAGVLARLLVKTADGKNFFIVTDEKIRITRQAPADWLKSDCDDSAWFAAITLGDPGIGPWNIAGSTVAQVPGKGPKAYGSNAVDAKIKERLAAVEEQKHFIVPRDFEIELVAADPVVINPITMVLDDKGRIIVSESHTYRYGPPGSPLKPFANPVVRLDPLPDGKGFTRTLVADGFDDPVMGLAVKGDKLWLTANNYLYRYDLAPSPLGGEGGVRGAKTAPGKQPTKGIAINKRTLLVDRNKAWNPFGMFVLEWGPDGKLYMSVGNHAINIEGPDGKISGRGSSGIIVRMNPDGTKMERLVHGLRVPYSFEFDPFGQLWLLSNGEGNPNRFVRVLEGVDYHCYSRSGVDNNWLAGNHPLAPPCAEVHDGAHTQFMRYYAAAYPAEYQGNLFACNWGRHGFAGANRGIFRFVLDDRNNIVKKETLVTCADPHFRPSHIVVDADGNLLIADWYGRDDESDMTGRIWRLKYIGKDRPVVKHKLDAPEWQNDDYAIEALGSPHHLIRAKAMEELRKRQTVDVRDKLRKYSAETKDALGAAHAVWLLAGMGESEARNELHPATLHVDWKVRRLAVNLQRRCFHGPGKVACQVNEKDPAVLLEAALGSAALFAFPGDAGFKGDPARRCRELTDVLMKGAAKDPHLRYEAAWHLARHADEGVFTQLLTYNQGLVDANNADVRLAGLIAIDVACYENLPTKKAALEALAKALESPGKLDHQLLLMMAHLDGDASLVPALEKLIARDDLPTATIAKAVLVLKAKSGSGLAASKLSAAAGKRLIEAVEKGALKVASPADQLVLFEFLESEGPTPFALKQIAGQLRSNQAALSQAAHGLARRIGPKAASLADVLWPSVLNPKTKFEEVLDSMSTLARIQQETPNLDNWNTLLKSDDPHVRSEAVRWWRVFKGKGASLDLLVSAAPVLIKKDPGIKDDLAVVLQHLGQEPTALGGLDLPRPQQDKEALAIFALKELADMPAGTRSRRAALGLQVFERNACTKCHTTATQTTALAPSLKGIGGQKLDYLVESVLFPSKIIKTGFETEVVVLANGKTLSGLVKDEGKVLRVLNLDRDERIAKTDVESRAVSRVSIMPEGQEQALSRREFVDLIVYLATLK